MRCIFVLSFFKGSFFVNLFIDYSEKRVFIRFFYLFFVYLQSILKVIKLILSIKSPVFIGLF